MTKNIIVGTAGHIDHGKTALVRALTGIDADRLAEEKRRGITIDLGFAHLPIADGVQLGFVDVPGHERFVKNMLAGVGGIDLLMLVIAADESIMPQTREHFDICRLLDVRRGLVALTKTDLVDPDLVELVKLETEEYLAGSFLEEAPICPVSSKTESGVDDLRSVLHKLAVDAEPKNSRHHFRLPIDRVFVMKGFGTVVTGTLVSGTLSADSEVEVLPAAKRVRVRGLEVHGGAVPEAVAGQRTAVNLSNIAAGGLARGMVLTAAGKFEPTRRIDCSVDLLPSAKPLKYGARVHFHAGTAELEGRVYFLDRRTVLQPGERAYAQMRFRDALPVWRGDRFIIRRFSPVITIGGGVVLDNHAPKHRLDEEWRPRLEVLDRGEPEEVLEVLLRGAAHGTGAREITARTAWLDSELETTARAVEQRGRIVRIHESPAYFVHRDDFRAAMTKTLDLLTAFHHDNPLLPGAAKEAMRTSLFPAAPAFFLDALLAHLAREKKAAVEGEMVRLATHRIVLREEEAAARDKIVAAFHEAGLAVPALPEVLEKLPVDRPRARRILDGLLREGVLVKVTAELVFHSEALDELRGKLARQKLESDRLTVPAFKDLAGISRKYAIPLLEYLDRQRLTRRVGDERVIL